MTDFSDALIAKARGLYRGLNYGNITYDNPRRQLEEIDHLLDEADYKGEYWRLDDRLPQDSTLAKDYLRMSVIPFCYLQMAIGEHTDLCDRMERISPAELERESADIKRTQRAIERSYLRSKYSTASSAETYDTGLAMVFEALANEDRADLREQYDRRSIYGCSEEYRSWLGGAEENPTEADMQWLRRQSPDKPLPFARITEESKHVEGTVSIKILLDRMKIPSNRRLELLQEHIEEALLIQSMHTSVTEQGADYAITFRVPVSEGQALQKGLKGIVDNLNKYDKENPERYR